MILALMYVLPMTFIFLYSLIQLSLVWEQRRYIPPKAPALTTFPKVCIQLPVYNEMYVIERLLNSVADIEYPNLEIQILDDSTDQTSAIIKQLLPTLPKNFFHLQRPDRKGFKAGALAYGLEKTDAELIAIFDADFVPSTDFLIKTVSFFQDKSVAVVQSRWGHLNENKSLLTRLQAFGLNAHFFIEQTGRNTAKHFINFNGTGGVWRKESIENAGGWSSDTLTEDLDLSYRAQMKGWNFVYVDNLESPAELPESMPAIRSQQYRWMKGGAECLIKNTKKLWRSPSSFLQKVHGSFHLLNSSVFLFVFLVSLVSLVITFIPNLLNQYHALLGITIIFQVNWIILGMFYWLAFKRQNTSILLFISRFFWFLTYMMGLSFHNTVAVLEGYLGRKTPFVRTPKTGNSDGGMYKSQKIYPLSYIEVLLTFLFLLAFLVNFWETRWGMLPFHGMSALGYGMVVYYTLKHSK